MISQMTHRSMINTPYRDVWKGTVLAENSNRVLGRMSRHGVPKGIQATLLALAVMTVLSTGVNAADVLMPHASTFDQRFGDTSVVGQEFHDRTSTAALTPMTKTRGPNMVSMWQEADSAEGWKVADDTVNSDSSAWWDDDVWSHPDRPFLYYGHPAKHKALHAPHEPNTVKSASDTENVSVVVSPTEKKPQATPKPARKLMDDDDHVNVVIAPPTRLEDLKTVKALQEERQRRLHVAIMDPSADNMARFQEVNAYMLGLSHRFAAAWERSRLENPEYDWTATHPTANFVRVADQEAVREAKAQYLHTLSGDVALIVLGHSDDPNTRLLARIVAGFARTYHYDTLGIVTNPEAFEQPSALSTGKAKETQSVLQEVFGDMPVKPNRGHVSQMGLTLFPAVVLVANNEATTRHPEFQRLALRAGARVTLLATGVVSGEELERRLVRRLRADPTPRATAPERVPGADAFHTLPVDHDRGSTDAGRSPLATTIPSPFPVSQERQPTKVTKER